MKNKKNKKKNMKIILLITVIVFSMILLFIIYKKMFKNNKNGDNMNSEQIVDYILNINSYKAKIYVETISNKNNNKYVINQEYNTENGNIEEVLEPNNISGVKIIKQNNTLRVENSNLNLSKIFESYSELENNYLDLSSFINDYKNASNSSYKEENNEIIMETINNNNKYIKNKTLYIDKISIKPIKLIIKDNNQKSTINIIYSEIELN